MQYYRLVSDYGFGDKAWLERMLSPSQILDAFNRIADTNYESLEDLEYIEHPIYRIELDNEGDEEDWDWMDS